MFSCINFNVFILGNNSINIHIIRKVNIKIVVEEGTGDHPYHPIDPSLISNIERFGTK